MAENKDFLGLVIKNNFLESQNVQLLLNLQLQARTIIDLKNMIHKQQLFIEENDIGSSAVAQARSKFYTIVIVLLDIAIFLGDNNDLEEAEDDDDQIDEQEEIDHDLMMEENKEDVTERVISQLRQSNNGNPAVIQPSNQRMEGFTGIVGIGFGSKKAGLLPAGGVKAKK